MNDLPPAAAADPWGTFLADIRGVGIDYLRAKLIDVERTTDDKNIPDQADLRYGSTLTAPAGQVPLWVWLAGATVVILGVVFIARMK